MTVKVIGLIRLKDKSAFESYRSQVGATVERSKGRVVSRGLADKNYWDELPCGDFTAFVELTFSSAEDADRWAYSPEYQALLDVRSKAMDLSLIRIQT
mgnify:CR=1 FL=1